MFKYFEQYGGVLAEYGPAGVIITVVTGITAFESVTETVDISPDTEMMYAYAIVARVNRAIFVVKRRGDKGCSDRAVEIVPTVAIDLIQVVTVITGIA